MTSWYLDNKDGNHTRCMYLPSVLCSAHGFDNHCPLDCDSFPLWFFHFGKFASKKGVGGGGWTNLGQTRFAGDAGNGRVYQLVA